MTEPSTATARAFLASLSLETLGASIRRRQLTSLAAAYGPRFTRQLGHAMGSIDRTSAPGFSLIYAAVIGQLLVDATLHPARPSTDYRDRQDAADLEEALEFIADLAAGDLPISIHYAAAALDCEPSDLAADIIQLVAYARRNPPPSRPACAAPAAPRTPSAPSAILPSIRQFKKIEVGTQLAMF